MAEKIGKYRVIERIGRGGMGMIFKAHDPLLDRLVALKVISPEVEVTDELRARFFREAQACAKLSHPNIVTVYDMGEDEGRLYIVMELLDGQELRQLIARGNALPLGDKLSIMAQMCSGLHYAHQKGIIHRDIKPGNIMVLRDGQVKILDFGIAQIQTNTTGLTRTGLIMGTLKYISPEQVRGVATHRSDIFSVGSVSYELLSSRAPFAGADPMLILEHLQKLDPPALDTVDPAIPREVAAIVERAMQKDPAKRFGDLAAMRAELVRVQQALAEHVERLRAGARAHRDRIAELEAALTARIGPRAPEPALPPIDAHTDPNALQALERDLGVRVVSLQTQIARADALAPALQRGDKLLAAHRFDAAAAQFEAIVAEMPEHARARERLEQARAAAARQHERSLAETVVRAQHAARGTAAWLGELATVARRLPWPAWAGVAVGLVALTLGVVWWAGSAVRVAPDGRAERVVSERPERPAVAARPDAPRSESAPAPAATPPAPTTPVEQAPAREVAMPARDIVASRPAPVTAPPLAKREVAEASPRVAAVPPRPSEMEQARARALTARREAERVAAAFYAPKLFAAAQAKEQEGGAALGRSDAAAAIRLLGEAQSEYQAAALEAKRETEKEWQLAPLKASVEQARARTRTRREEAIAAEADRLAKDLFAVAQTKHVEADGLAARQSFAAAARAYDEATERYAEAAAAGRTAR
jgi:predicted Ser/Thr protein kinase